MNDKETTFDQLTQVLGEDLAIKFSVQFSGREIRIGKLNFGNTSLGKEISKAVGKEALTKLQTAWGGKTFYVAAKPVKELVPTAINEQRRNETIRRLRKQGRSRTEIAKQFGLSERRISMITGSIQFRVRM
jgi:Mor family transcriptional regulator